MDSVIWPHRPWERVATGIRGEEVETWRGSNSCPPNEPVECQLVGFRETKDPALASFVKVLPPGLFVTAAIWERNSCQGRERSDTSPKRSVYPPA